jgi:hypothetical protein
VNDSGMAINLLFDRIIGGYCISLPKE